MLDIYTTFCALAAVRSQSGREGEVMKKIAELAAPYGGEARLDKMGNLVIRKKGRDGAKKLLLAAHADEIGFVASYIEEDGFIRFGPVGGHSPATLIGVPVVFASGAEGVIYKNQSVEIKDAKLSDLFIDVGASSREEALKRVSIGEHAGFSAAPRRIGGNIVSPYLDDKLGCAVLLAALSETDSENDVYFAFTVQEEVGCRGAHVVGYTVEPDYAVVVDVAPTGDQPSPSAKSHVKLGGGPTNKILDSQIVCSPDMRARIDAAAKRAGVKVQDELLVAGGTDGGALQTARAGAVTGGVSLPTRYIHSAVETASEQDAADAARLLIELVNAPLDERAERI